MERPVKPQTGYFIFQNEMRDKYIDELKDMPFNDRGKFIGEKWKDLTEEERQIYNEKSKQLKQEYDEKMKKFYELYPEEKKKDEEEARQKKEKKLSAKEPPEFKPNDKNLRAMFAVAYVKKYYNQNNFFLPANNASKKFIHELYDTLQDKVQDWKSAWTQMSLEEKQQIKDFHQEWLQAKLQ